MNIYLKQRSLQHLCWKISLRVNVKLLKSERDGSITFLTLRLLTLIEFPETFFIWISSFLAYVFNIADFQLSFVTKNIYIIAFISHQQNHQFSSLSKNIILYGY